MIMEVASRREVEFDAEVEFCFPNFQLVKGGNVKDYIERKVGEGR